MVAFYNDFIFYATIKIEFKIQLVIQIQFITIAKLNSNVMS